MSLVSVLPYGAPLTTASSTLSKNPILNTDRKRSKTRVLADSKRLGFKSAINRSWGPTPRPSGSDIAACVRAPTRLDSPMPWGTGDAQ